MAGVDEAGRGALGGSSGCCGPHLLARPLPPFALERGARFKTDDAHSPGALGGLPEGSSPGVGSGLCLLRRDRHHGDRPRHSPGDPAGAAAALAPAGAPAGRLPAPAGGDRTTDQPGQG